MNLDNCADKPAPRAKSKPNAALIKSTVKKPASKKQAQTMYDVAIQNGWGPRLKGLTRSIAHLKKTPA